MLKRILYNPHVSFEMEIDGKTETSGSPLVFSPVLSGRAYNTIHGYYKREDTGLPEFPGFSAGSIRGIATDAIERGIVIIEPTGSGESRNITIFANDHAVVKGSFVAKKELYKRDLENFPEKARRAVPGVPFVPYLVFAIKKSDEFAPVYKYLRTEGIQSGEKELTAMFPRTINTKLMKTTFSGRIKGKSEPTETKLYVLGVNKEDLPKLELDVLEKKFTSKKKFIVRGELVPLESIVEK